MDWAAGATTLAGVAIAAGATLCVAAGGVAFIPKPGGGGIEGPPSGLAGRALGTLTRGAGAGSDPNGGTLVAEAVGGGTDPAAGFARVVLFFPSRALRSILGFAVAI